MIEPAQEYPPVPGRALRPLARLAHLFALVEGAGLAMGLFTITGIAAWQFVERNATQRGLPFPRAPIWADGVLRHTVFLIGFLGGAYATHTIRHIRVDAVTRLLSPRARLALRVITTMCAIAITACLVYGSYKLYLVNCEENDEASQIGQLFTPARGALIMVGGYLLICFHFVVQWLIDLAWLVSKRPPPDEWIVEAHAEAPTSTVEDPA